MHESAGNPTEPPVGVAAEPARPAPGLAGLLLSIVGMVVCMVGCFAMLAVFFLAGAWVYDGMAGINGLIDNFDRFHPRALVNDAGAQRAMYTAGSLIYLAGLGGILIVARMVAGRGMADALGWRGPWPKMNRTAWVLLVCSAIYHIGAGASLRYFFPDFAKMLIPPREFGAMVLSFLMIVVLAPLVEELLFRGWMFGALRARFSAAVTILVTAFLFAIVHTDPTGLYPVAVLLPGFVLSLIRERTGSVKAAIAGHALYNGVGWTLLVLAGIFLVR